ncbi:MAG: queuosine precursor transporter [Bacteroidales bacterium]
MENNKVSVPFMVMGIVFCVCLVVSNILETKLIQMGPITATAGLIVFPLSYIINDCIAEVWGFKKARLIIWAGFAMNFLAVMFIQIAIHLPGANFWEHQDAFATIFGSTPRIAVASLLAFLVGSFLNAYIMSKMKVMTKGKYFSLRAVVSTLIGESADSLVFFPIAFAGIVPVEELFLLIVTQAILKSAYEFLILPITLKVVNYVKRIDKSDVYDTDISYNVLKVKEV